MNRATSILISMLLFVLQSGCSDDTPEDKLTISTPSKTEPTRQSKQSVQKVKRPSNFTQVMNGSRLYQEHCAACHGKRAEGAANWRKRDAQGKFPPPPLNGTGHAWHHPSVVLHSIIKDGTLNNQGNMPPWKDKLTDQQINDIVAWFQSRWSDEIYSAWLEVENRSSH